jgi:hypothetical protein
VPARLRVLPDWGGGSVCGGIRDWHQARGGHTHTTMPHYSDWAPDWAPHAVALLLALCLPACAPGRGQVRDGTAVRDTAAAGAPVADLPLTAAQRQAFVGVYSVILGGEEMFFRIIEENGVLRGRAWRPGAEPENQESRRLLYQGGNVFRPEGMPDFTLTFVLEGARATRFTVRRPDGVMEGVRVP